MDEMWLKIERALRPYISDPTMRNSAINDLEALFQVEADFYETAIKDLGLLAESNEANWRKADAELNTLRARFAVAGAGR